MRKKYNIFTKKLYTWCLSKTRLNIPKKSWTFLSYNADLLSIWRIFLSKISKLTRMFDDKNPNMTKFDIFTKSFLFKTCWETLYCTKGFLGESPKGIWRHIPSDRKRAAINVGHGRVDQGIVSNKIRYQIIMIVSRYFFSDFLPAPEK